MQNGVENLWSYIKIVTRESRKLRQYFTFLNQFFIAKYFTNFISADPQSAVRGTYTHFTD